MPTPRQGPLGRMYHYRETSWGVDPTTPNMDLMPLADREGFRTNQTREQSVVYEGTFSNKGSFKGPIDASGERDMSLDYKYVGNDLMDVLGNTGYSRVGTLHKWVGMGLPLPFGLQKEYTQATAIIHRYPGIYATMMKFVNAVSGQQKYTISQMGKGGEFRAGIAGAVPLDALERKGYSYFDGAIFKDGTSLAHVAEFAFTVDRKATAKEGMFNAGQRAAVGFDVPLVEGDLGLIFTTDDGDVFYDQAINDTTVSLSCLYANKPLSGIPTKWLRFTMEEVLFSRSETGVGGAGIPDQTQHFIAQVGTTYRKARAIGTVAASTFSVTAANKVVSLKFQGGATIDTSLTEGAARTMDQIVADLNAAGPFEAAGHAYNLNGRLEIVTDDATSAGSVQWQTGTANSAHTLLGFGTTTFTSSAPSDLVVELFNDVSADYV